MLALLTLWWPFSYGYYTSIGIDSERIADGRLRYTYWRLRWHGDGSVRVGVETAIRPAPPRPPDRFDIAAVFLRPPRPQPPQTAWNRWGFDHVARRRGESAQPLPGRSRIVSSSHWIAVPHGLIVLLAAMLPLIGLLRRLPRRDAQPSASAQQPPEVLAQNETPRPRGPGCS